MNATGKKWKPVELEFYSDRRYDDPFHEAELDVLIRDRNGSSWKVPCFWDGGDLWKARFAAPHTGEYTYETICSDRSNKGLAAQTGSIMIGEYDEENPLYSHGPLRIMKDGRHFEYEDGTPFPWLGDTWWNLESSRMSEKGEVQFLAKDRARKGFTVISLINGFWCDLGPYDRRMSNEAGFAWTGSFGTINPAYYDIADKKIEAIVDEGLVPAIGAAWGFYIRFMGVEKMKEHVRYMIARYGAYPVVWLTAGEASMPFYDYQNTDQYDPVLEEAKHGWTEVLEYLKDTDPYHRLTTVHVTYNRITTDDIEKPELADFIMYQAGIHDGDQQMVAEQVKNLTRRGLEVTPKRPVINSETCYEGMLYQCGARLQRWLFWHAALDGCAGWTYGANGMFTASHEKDPFGTAYYGTNWGEQTWQEAVNFEGAAHVGNSRRYLNKYEWWKLEPVTGIVEEPEGKTEYEQTITAKLGENMIMAYVQRNISLMDRANYPYCIHFQKLEPGAVYRVAAYNPIRDYEVELGTETVQQDGRFVTPAFPILQDWVVILKKQEHEDNKNGCDS